MPFRKRSPAPAEPPEDRSCYRCGAAPFASVLVTTLEGDTNRWWLCVQCGGFVQSLLNSRTMRRWRELTRRGAAD